MKSRYYTSVAPAALAVVFGFGTAGAAVAATLGMYDASGVVTPATDAFTVDAGTATSIDFDINITTLDSSWGDEITIDIVAPDMTSFSYDGSDFGFPNFEGSFSATTSFAIAPTSAGGEWTVDFGNLFSSNQYDFPSTITISGEIPLPAALPLSLTAFASLAGLSLARRRRRKN